MAALTVTAVEPLTRLIVGGNDADATSALQALATMDLEEEAWRAVDDAIRVRLEPPVADAVVQAAAHVPLRGLRDVLRAIAADGSDLRASAAARGLVELGDEETLFDRLEELAANHGWQDIMRLPSDRLAEAPTSIWEVGHARDIFYVVAAGKAGRLGPLRQFLALVEAGDTPELFWGNPMYIASLLEPARPIPAVLARVVRGEWEAPPSRDGSADRCRVLDILAEGLLGESVF